MNEDLIAIGNRIKKAREGRGITQEDLAIMLDVNIMTISRWENGKTDMSAEKLLCLCRAINVTSDYILGLPNCQHDLEQLKKIRGIIING